jgi:hypothetical protein
MNPEAAFVEVPDVDEKSFSGIFVFLATLLISRFITSYGKS